LIQLLNIGALTKERVVKSVAVLGILAVALAVVLKTDNILVAFVLAFVINYLLGPVVNAIERSGVSRKLAVSSVFIILGGVAAAAITVLVPAASRQLSTLKGELPHFIDGITQLLVTSETRINAALAGVYRIDVSEAANRLLSGYSGSVYKNLPQVVSSSAAVAVLAPFFAFFMLLDGQRAAKKMLALVPNPLFEPALTLKHRINAQMGDFVRARLLEAGIVGLVVWLGLSGIGFSYPILLGVFAGLTNLIPYIGPFIGAAPAVLMALVSGASGWVLASVAGVYTLAQLIDNFLVIPLVVAKIVDLHPVVVVVVIIIGAQVAGILGMILSIPAACVLKLTLLAVYEHLTEFRR
jgi:putative permease